jgi:hypothetical protein
MKTVYDLIGALFRFVEPALGRGPVDVCYGTSIEYVTFQDECNNPKRTYRIITPTLVIGTDAAESQQKRPELRRCRRAPSQHP